jgi:hypothetical protein
MEILKMTIQHVQGRPRNPNPHVNQLIQIAQVRKGIQPRNNIQGDREGL